MGTRSGGRRRRSVPGGGGGDEPREALGERRGGEGEDEVRPREREHVAERGECGRRLPGPRALVGDRGQRVGQHRRPRLLGHLHEGAQGDKLH